MTLKQRISTTLSTSMAAVLGSASQLYAQIGGDEIQTTVSNAGAYLRRLALLIFVIMLIIGGLKMAASSNRDGIGMVIGSMIGIALTVLSQQIVSLVQSWAGGGLVF